MFDTAVIGSGPAGISAVLNLSLHNKSFIWFGAKSLSAKIEKSEKIANYPGVPMITGTELNKLFLKQIAEMGAELQDKTVTSIAPAKNGFMILAGNDIYEAKAVIIATGATAAKGFDGEERLLGKGVSYCATCDGVLYKGKTIAVYCASERFEHEVKYLAKLAKEVYLYAPYKSCAPSSENITVLNKGIKSIIGKERLEKLALTDGTQISVDALFIMRESVSPAVLLNGIETDKASIIVDRNAKTNIKGCFAAGDCTGRPYQIAKAAGEGNVAAHSVIEYLAELEK